MQKKEGTYQKLKKKKKNGEKSIKVYTHKLHCNIEELSFLRERILAFFFFVSLLFLL